MKSQVNNITLLKKIQVLIGVLVAVTIGVIMEAELKETKAELKNTQAELKDTQTEFKKTQTTLDKAIKRIDALEKKQ